MALSIAWWRSGPVFCGFGGNGIKPRSAVLWPNLLRRDIRQLWGSRDIAGLILPIRSKLMSLWRRRRECTHCYLTWGVDHTAARRNEVSRSGPESEVVSGRVSGLHLFSFSLCPNTLPPRLHCGQVIAFKGGFNRISSNPAVTATSEHLDPVVVFGQRKALIC
jgi:hypothetical protein